MHGKKRSIRCCTSHCWKTLLDIPPLLPRLKFVIEDCRELRVAHRRASVFRKAKLIDLCCRTGPGISISLTRRCNRMSCVHKSPCSAASSTIGKNDVQVRKKAVSYRTVSSPHSDEAFNTTFVFQRIPSQLACPFLPCTVTNC
jgi:hypothetical protein